MSHDLDTEVWQSLGEQDADWAVESKPGRKYGGWDDDLDAFYETGRARVDEALALVPDVRRDRALDWGSGTGRLTFTLAERFNHVTAIDISTSMQRLLAARAAQRGITNIEIGLVEDFNPTGDYDFVLSLITMQHLSDRAAVEQALQAMVRAVRTGGKVIVEIPVSAHNLRYRIQPRLQLYRILRRVGVNPKTLHAKGLSGIKMQCLPRDWVTSTLRLAGADVQRTREYRGTSHTFVWYVCERRR